MVLSIPNSGPAITDAAQGRSSGWFLIRRQHAYDEDLWAEAYIGDQQPP
jgi:hypothetical protein